MGGRRFSGVVVLMAGLLFGIILGGCSTYNVKRVSLDTEGGVTDRWTDTDARLTAETLIKRALDSSWFSDFQGKHDRKAVVVMGQMVNRSDQEINTHIFLNHFQDALINSGKVIFVAGEQYARQQAEAERQYQLQNARAGTVHGPGQQTGADFLLTGSINSFVASRGDKQVRFYETHLKAINLTTNEIIWSAAYRIKKIAHASGGAF
jgi:uncharacterized protein (TIGR02722 family)